MRDVTGFDRVLFYRFHEDGHGSVDAEARAPGLEPYLGLHYPASDIPVQARELYLRNWLRLIVDGRAAPARIVPTLRHGRPLDLSFAVLRSVSPVHLEYMANMGVRASMSISLIVRDRLWGLISCLNHSGPRRVPHDTRAACEFLGRLASLEIAAFNDRELLTQRAARRASEEVLSETMRASTEEDGVIGALLARPQELMDLVDAGGVAAVGPDGTSRTCGRTPPPALITAITAWLDSQERIRPFSTDALGTLFPPALAVSNVASGLLTFALPGRLQRRLLWFRPEVIETVSWGGDPTKSVAADASGRLHPRHSFAVWREQLRYHSHRWTASDLEAANELQRRALEVDLERRLASEERAVRSRDELIAVVSHDLRSPLTVISLQASLLLTDPSSSADAASRVAAANIQRSVGHAQALIEDLLDLAKLEGQHFAVRLEPVDSRALMDEARLGVSPLAEAKNITLSQELIDAPTLKADAHQILRVLTNLLGNAIKFTPKGGKVTLRAERTDAGELKITVADTGPGIPPDELPWVFERYWQARPSSQLGAGLGLYVARGIVSAHGGRIWAESSASGARLILTLPLNRGRS